MQDLNRQSNEFLSLLEENRSVHEMGNTPEYPSYGEQMSYAEAPNNTNKTSKQNKTNKDAAGILSKFLASAVTVVAVGLSSAPVRETFLKEPSAVIELADLEIGSQELYYAFTIESQKDLEVVLYNDFTDRRADLSNGRNEGLFSNLKTGVPYTLAVVGEGTFGETELFSKKLTLKPHPMETTHVKDFQCIPAPHSIGYLIDIEGGAPLRLLFEGEETQKEIPLQTGANEGVFTDLMPEVDYTLSVVGEGVGGTEVLKTQVIRLEKDPAQDTVAEISGYGVDGNVLYGTVEVESTVPVKAVLTGRDTTQEFALENGVNEIHFENIPLNTKFTLSIVAEGIYGDVVITSENFETPHPIEYTYVEIQDFSSTDGTLNYTVYVEGYVPVEELTMTVNIYKGEELVYSVPFEHTDGTLDTSATELNIGQMSGIYEAGALPGESYTIQITGTSNTGEIELNSQTITI